MALSPAYSIGLALLALLAAIGSWAWLRFAKFPTGDNRDIAARVTGALFAFVAVACGALLLVH